MNEYVTNVVLPGIGILVGTVGFGLAGVFFRSTDARVGVWIGSIGGLIGVGLLMWKGGFPRSVSPSFIAFLAIILWPLTGCIIGEIIRRKKKRKQDTEQLDAGDS